MQPDGRVGRLRSLVPSLNGYIVARTGAGRDHALRGPAHHALIVAAGRVLRTSEPDAVEFGVAQVRRTLESGELRALHLVFAPYAARPILLALVRLHNRTSEPLLVHYSELWEVEGAAPRAAEAACVCATDGGTARSPTSVRAWRGDVSEELEQTVESWLEQLGPDPLAAYRGLF